MFYRLRPHFFTTIERIRSHTFEIGMLHMIVNFQEHSYSACISRITTFTNVGTLEVKEECLCPCTCKSWAYMMNVYVHVHSKSGCEG